jgi:uncharacterized membrane protein YdjX (TVP38/TMEM64 family)
MGILIIAATSLLLFSPQGATIRSNPQLLADDVQHWVARHPVLAPAVFISIYLLASMLALPVWVLQILSGYGFGLVMGIVWCCISAAVSATLIVKFSHFLAGDYFHDRIEPRMARLHNVMDKVGHNGLLTVMAVRLMHVIPFGLSNYLFGVTSIRPIEAGLGTLVGGLPAIAAYVAAASSVRSRWMFWACLVGVNVLLVLPIAIRWYLTHRRPRKPAVLSPSKPKQ